MNVLFIVLTSTGALVVLAQAFDLAGKLWALPVTAVGVLIGAAGWVFGARVSIQHNAIAFENFPWGKPYSALTLGNCILCTCELSLKISTYAEQQGGIDRADVVLGKHEEAHTYQYQRLGVLLIPLWFICGLNADKNPLEHQADVYALGGDWWPWPSAN